MTRSIRVLVAGHDWGGINILAPLLRAWSRDEGIAPEFLGAPVIRRDLLHRIPGLSLVGVSEELTEWLCHRPAELDRFLRDRLELARYDVILCSTSAHALLERKLFAIGRGLGIPTIAFCDMWWAYAERFHDGDTWAIPDRIWVIDEVMQQAARALEWPQPVHIEVVGSPLFGELAHLRDHRDQDGSVIRFISEPASTKFPEARIDEFALADMLVAARDRAGLALPIVVRPHPTDLVEAWRRWAFARRDQDVHIETLPLDEAVKQTRMAVGISSILLAELRMCGIAVASVQPDSASAEYYCLPFEELGIARVASVEGLASWLSTPGPMAPPPAARLHLDAVAAATRSLRAVVAARNLVASA
jgi:hypothetical protein